MATQIDDNVEIQQHVLDMLRLKYSIRVGYSTLQSIGMKRWEEHFTAHSIYEMYASILGQKKVMKYSVEVPIPKNWWEHLKLQLFPRSKYVPVKFRFVKREIEFNHWLLFPECNWVPSPGNPVIFTETPNVKGIQKID
jgi:hypothetical protein